MNNEEKYKKNIHHIHDKSYKDLYSKREVALDLFKNISNANWSKDLKAEDLTLVNNTYITADYEEREADIVYKANINNSEVVFYILLESIKCRLYNAIKIIILYVWNTKRICSQY